MVLEAVLQADLETAPKTHQDESRIKFKFWLVNACRTLALHSGHTTEFIVFSLVLQPSAGHVLSS